MIVCGPILVTVSQGAAMLGMKPHALLEHVRAGRVPRAKVEGRWLMKPADLETFAERLIAEHEGWILANPEDQPRPARTP